MFLESLLTAAAVGASPERFLICPFFALGLSLSDRLAGLRFLLGRILGIVLLGLVITTIGIPLNISPNVLDLILGVSLIVMAGYVLVMARKQNHGHGRGMARAGFGLGLYRGLLNPDRLLILLVPLLWGVNMLEGLAISLAYALTSSIYLLIGFVSADVLKKISHHDRAVRIGGAVILALLGVYYLIIALTGGV